MRQKQKPQPDNDSPDRDFPDAKDPSYKTKSAIRNAEDVTESIADIIDGGQTLKPPQCCGTLPCKGRVPACYSCDICMDCITGAGCGHNDSTHDPQSGLSYGMGRRE